MYQGGASSCDELSDNFQFSPETKRTETAISARQQNLFDQSHVLIFPRHIINDNDSDDQIKAKLKAKFHALSSKHIDAGAAHLNAAEAQNAKATALTAMPDVNSSKVRTALAKAETHRVAADRHAAVAMEFHAVGDNPVYHNVEHAKALWNDADRKGKEAGASNKVAKASIKDAHTVTHPHT